MVGHRALAVPLPMVFPPRENISMFAGSSPSSHCRGVGIPHAPVVETLSRSNLPQGLALERPWGYSSVDPDKVSTSGASIRHMAGMAPACACFVFRCGSLRRLLFSWNRATHLLYLRFCWLHACFGFCFFVLFRAFACFLFQGGYRALAVRA